MFSPSEVDEDIQFALTKSGKVPIEQVTLQEEEERFRCLFFVCFESFAVFSSPRQPPTAANLPASVEARSDAKL